MYFVLHIYIYLKFKNTNIDYFKFGIEPPK